MFNQTIKETRTDEVTAAKRITEILQMNKRNYYGSYDPLWQGGLDNYSAREFVRRYDKRVNGER